jgi:hypothetical protein
MTAHTTEISEERLRELSKDLRNGIEQHHRWADPRFTNALQFIDAELQRRAAAPVDVLVQGDDIELQARAGLAMARRRLALDAGRWATHHEDYVPIFERILALLQCQPRDPVDVRDSAGVVELDAARLDWLDFNRQTFTTTHDRVEFAAPKYMDLRAAIDIAMAPPRAEANKEQM